MCWRSGAAVELEPRGRAAQFLGSGVGRLGDFFQRVARQGADHHAGAHGHGCAHAGNFFWVGQAVVGHRSQQHRPVSLAKAVAGGYRAWGQVRQRLGQQADAIQCPGGCVPGPGPGPGRFRCSPGMGFDMVACLAHSRQGPRYRRGCDAPATAWPSALSTGAAEGVSVMLRTTCAAGCSRCRSVDRRGAAGSSLPSCWIVGPDRTAGGAVRPT